MAENVTVIEVGTSGDVVVVDLVEADAPAVVEVVLGEAGPGERGPAGPKGDKGDPGDPGDPGTPGTDGFVVLDEGQAIPADTPVGVLIFRRVP